MLPEVYLYLCRVGKSATQITINYESTCLITDLSFSKVTRSKNKNKPQHKKTKRDKNVKKANHNKTEIDHNKKSNFFKILCKTLVEFG